MLQRVKYFFGHMQNSVAIFLQIFQSYGPITAYNCLIQSHDWLDSKMDKKDYTILHAK